MRRTPPGWPPLAVLAALMVVAAVVVMHAGRDTTFYFDDWDFVTQRRDWRPHIFLYPHNEHLSLLPVAVYKLLLETVGMDAYGVFRAVSVGFNLACGALLFLYVRPRLGPWPAVAMAAGLTMTGGAAYDLIWPFQIGYLGSLVSGLGALLALDRGTRRGDVVACALVALSLSSSSVGVVILGAVALDVTLRSQRVRRAWIWLVPAILYGAWYLKYGVGDAQWDKITQGPQRFWDALPTAVSAVTGLGGGIAQTAAFVLLVAVALEFGRPDWNRRLLTAIALTAGFWTLTAIGRPELPVTEMRYVYPAAVFVVIAAAEALRRYRPPDRQGFIFSLVFGIGIVSSAAAINPYADSWRVYALDTKASVTAAEMLGPGRLAPEIQLDPRQPQLRYGLYHAAAEEYDSTPAWTAGEIPRLADGERMSLDAALVRLHGVAPRPVPRRPPDAECREHDGTDTAAPVRGSGIRIEAGSAPVQVRILRFASTPPVDPTATVPARARQHITIGADSSDRPWSFAAQSEAPFVLCRLA